VHKTVIKCWLDVVIFNTDGLRVWLGRGIDAYCIVSINDMEVGYNDCSCIFPYVYIYIYIYIYMHTCIRKHSEPDNMQMQVASVKYSCTLKHSYAH
jgi:hypothetical protein